MCRREFINIFLGGLNNLPVEKKEILETQLSTLSSHSVIIFRLLDILV